MRIFAILFVAAVGLVSPADAPPLALSHAWIVVGAGARERKTLEKAGFRIAPTINRHDGQGTASVTVELLNGFLELIYPDPTVPVSPATKAGAEKFRLKSAWRETGYSPIGVVFDRTPATPETLPDLEDFRRLDGERHFHRDDDTEGDAQGRLALDLISSRERAPARE